MAKLTLQDFEHLRSNPMVNFKTETVDGKDFVIVSYAIANPEFWMLPLAFETRGHTFDTETGELGSAAFQKFFNIGEKDFTQFNRLNFTGMVSFSKRDGSMLPTMVLNGKVYVKTKKSFASDVALAAQSNISVNEQNFVKEVYAMGYSVIFEYTDPDWQIVINYGKSPKFTVLAARSLTTLEYMDFDVLSSIAEKYGVSMIERFADKTIAEILEEVNTVSDAEGYVIWLSDGSMVKQKFDWYKINHYVMTDMRERDIARAVVRELVDDIKARVSLAYGDLSKIEAIEERVTTELNLLRIQVETHSEACKLMQLEPRHIAVHYKSHPLRGLIMRQFKGQEVNYPEYWERNHLKNYSLKCVYNDKF